MKRKLIALVLAFAMLVPMCTTVAVGVDVASIAPDIQEKMLQILVSIEHEKEFYGLADVDFSAVTIGQELASYQLRDEGLVPSPIRMFPVLCGGKIVSLFSVAQTSEQETYVQLNVDPLVDILNAQLASDMEFAVVYEDDASFIYTADQLEALRSRFTVPQKLRLCSLAASTQLDVTAYMAATPVPYADPGTCFLQVPIVKQPNGSNLCWAACCASLIKYLVGETYSCQDLDNIYFGGYDTGCDGDIAVNVVLNGQESAGYPAGFNLGYTNKYGVYLNKTVALQKLVENCPIYTNFEVRNVRHAVLIRGINTYYNTFSMMDPAYGNYTTGTIGSNTWTYVDSNTGNTMSMCFHAYKE